MEITRDDFKNIMGPTPEPVDEEASQCIICTDYIKYYAIPEGCNHNQICWNCVLK